MFIDYSEEYIGFIIIKQNDVKHLLPQIKKLKQYKNTEHKKLYLRYASRKLRTKQVQKLIYSQGVVNKKNNHKLIAEITSFLKRYQQKSTFLSIDDNQFHSITKLIKHNVICTTIVKESSLKKGSKEYMLSLIIDNILNVYRKRKSK